MILGGYGVSIMNSSTWRKKTKYDIRIIVTSGLIALYLSMVTYMSIWNSLRKLYIYPVLFILFFYFLYVLDLHIMNTELCIPSREQTKSKPKYFIMFFCIILLGELIYWFAYYPGGFNLDAYGQWDQVHGLMKLNNWHPVFTTALYWIVTRIFDSFAFCIFAQLVFFSISLAYFLIVLLEEKAPPKLLLYVAIYISLNPAIGLNNVCLVKDVLFCIAVIWLMIVLIRIVESKCQWLRSALHMGGTIFVLLAISLIRHNGIFVVVSVIASLAFLFRKNIKNVLIMAVTYLLFLSLIEGPIFTSLGVEQHSNAVGEIVGVPMAIMANNLVSDYENTPEDVKDFLLSIAELDEWKNLYILGEWDSCKWDFGGTELLQGVSLFDISKLTWHSICASPESAYKSVRENTRVVWQVIGPVEWKTWVYIEENDYSIAENSNRFCRTIVDALTELTLLLPGTFLFWNVGVVNIIYLLLMGYSVFWREYRKMIYVIPVLSYNLLTMLLLCGPSHRYFYFNSVIVLPIVLLMFCKHTYE